MSKIHWNEKEWLALFEAMAKNTDSASFASKVNVAQLAVLHKTRLRPLKAGTNALDTVKKKYEIWKNTGIVIPRANYTAPSMEIKEEKPLTTTSSLAQQVADEVVARLIPLLNLQKPEVQAEEPPKLVAMAMPAPVIAAEPPPKVDPVSIPSEPEVPSEKESYSGDMRLQIYMLRERVRALDRHVETLTSLLRGRPEFAEVMQTVPQIEKPKLPRILVYGARLDQLQEVQRRVAGAADFSFITNDHRVSLDQAQSRAYCEAAFVFTKWTDHSSTDNIKAVFGKRMISCNGSVSSMVNEISLWLENRGNAVANK